MSALAVSVIVVSRGRAADLPLCLLGLSQLDYPTFEVVLVADAAGIAAARTLPFFDDLKVVQFDEANISAARNLGIAEAAGDITAFIDDDAVPEPSWLTHLTSGFSQPDVAGVGGFVIGRNGISFQWKARSVDCMGVTTPLAVDETKTSVLTPQNGHAIKTEGTNMALRRDVIAQMGGFDPAFRFYLDETDVNYRLATLGYQTAIAPLAQVHHGYKASETRRKDRVPTDLYQIGSSLSVYLRKHAAPDVYDDTISRARQEQRNRALRYLVAGLIEPRDVRRLLNSFDKGVIAGLAREISPLREIPHARSGFLAMPVRYAGEQVVSAGRWKDRKHILEVAEAAVRSGRRASAFVFSWTARPHKVRFNKFGVWVQSGGLFGRSVRVGRRVRFLTLRKRLTLELKRLAKLRNFPS